MYFDNKSIVKAALMSFGLITANLIVEFIMIFFGLMPEDALLAIMMQVIIRIVTGCVGLALMKRFYVASLNEFFTNKIPKIVWVIMIPLYLSVIARLSLIPMIVSATGEYTLYFFLNSLPFLASNFIIAAVFIGLSTAPCMNRLSEKNVRFAMIFIVGALFFASRIMNLIYGVTLGICIKTAIYALCLGLFLTALYMITENLLFIIVLTCVWSLLDKIPNYFFGFSQATELAKTADSLNALIQTIGFAAAAIIVVLKYDKIKYNFDDNY